MKRYRRIAAKHTQESRRASSGRIRRIGKTTLVGVLLTVVLIGTGFVYVQQANSVATAGLTIRDMEQSIAELKRVNTELELRAQDVRGLATVEQASEQLNLTAKAAIDYLPSVPSTVAFGE